MDIDAFPILKRKFVMVDLETLANQSDAAIVSIGAVKFDFVNGITSEFKVNVTPESSKAAGLVISKDTIEWWKQQSPEAIRGWVKNAIPLSDAVDQFVDWWGTNKKLIFCCNGMSFDSPVLQSSFRALRRTDQPWSHHNEFDLRTLYHLFNVSTETMKSGEVVVYHDALEDCKFQVKNLLSLFAL